MNIQEIPEEEFLAEVRRRLNIGQFGWHGLMSTEQSDYHGMWTELYQRLRDKYDNTSSLTIREQDVYLLLIRWMHELIDAKPRPPKPEAIATTLLGRVEG